METKSIHLALQLTLCTLALCARGISAQEEATIEQPTEANEFDGRASQQANHFEATNYQHIDSDGTREHSVEFEVTRANEDDERMKYFEATEANAYDDRTLLDTFGQVAKEFLTKRVIPDTDADCKWDWKFVRCGK